MRARVRLGATAGALAPLLFLVLVGSLTADEWSFLRRSGWSAVHRSQVEWPSLLALGKNGWVLVAAFIVCGLLGLAFGFALYAAQRSPLVRTAATLILVLASGLALEAFRADAPTAQAVSWHDRVHNLAYPLIPLGAIGAALALALGLPRRGAWRAAWLASITAVVVMPLGLGLTAIDSIAQLARYILFATILAWLEMVALALARSTRE